MGILDEELKTGVHALSIVVRLKSSRVLRAVNEILLLFIISRRRLPRSGQLKSRHESRMTQRRNVEGVSGNNGVISS